MPEIIDALGGPTAFASLIGKTPSAASEMKRTGSIPGRYWHRIVVEAGARGIEDVSYEALAVLHDKVPEVVEARA